MLVYYVSPNLDWLPRLPGARELIEPPVATAPGWLQAPPPPGAEPKWTLIYARMPACDATCAEDLERVRQVHVALRRDEERVQRMFLHGAEPAADSDNGGDPGLVTRSLDDPDAESVVRAVGPERLQSGRLVLADPSGNLMAIYPTNVEQKELLRDLKRLLAAGSH
jgi:hypothetical protein